MAARIIAVDDEPSVRNTVARALKRAGYSVEIAEDGPAALALYKEMGADFVVSDYHMPGMLGIELLRALRAHDPRARVIILSGGLSAKETAELIESGAIRVLEKPEGINELAEAVGSALAAPLSEPAVEGIMRGPLAAAQRIRVLFVDDEPAMLLGLSDVAELAGYDGMTACGGAEGLRLFRESAPDVVVSDLHMPDMSGLEMLRLIRADYPDARVIILSGEADEAERTALIDAGALCVLRKPIGMDGIIAAIEGAVSGPV